jgi:hypothetical protein
MFAFILWSIQHYILHSMFCFCFNQVKLVKAGKMMSQAVKVNLNVDMRQGRLFAVKPSKDALDSSNTFTHDKSKLLAFSLNIDHV